jgi:hypothetical protein
MDFLERARITPSGLAASDRLGSACALSADGKTLIVGSYLSDINAVDAGVVYVYVYKHDAWEHQATLSASDATTTDRFGWSVALSADGNTAIIGALFDDAALADSGSAYVFTRSGTTWTEQTKLVASDQAAGDHNFGVSVDISASGDDVIVGAYFYDGVEANTGVAYVYTRSGVTWTEQAILVDSAPNAADAFGRSVSMSGDGNTVAVGAYRDDDSVTDAGSVTVFTRSGATWTEQARILGDDQGTTDYFGYANSISADGNTLLVGAYLKDNAPTDSGGAYVYTRSGSTWTEEAKLSAFIPEASGQFGFSVALSGDGLTAIITENRDGDAGVDSGTAYIFKRVSGRWLQRYQLVPSNIVANDRIGNSCCLDYGGKTAVIGAINSDVVATDAGIAWVFGYPRYSDDIAEVSRLDSPPTNYVSVTPNDSTDLSEASRYLMVTVGGDVYVNMYGVGTNIKLPALTAGKLYPIRVSRVYFTGTTATGIIAFY